MKKRQKIRKGIILSSFFFFPITIYYFSPAQIVDAAHKGIMNGSAIIFVLQFLVSLVLGRAFCGWVCPGAGLSEACAIASPRKVRGGRYNWIKYFIWAPWIIAILILVLSAGGYQKIEPFYQTKHGISVADPFAYIPYFTVVGLIVILAFSTGRRGFCHYTCWMAPFMIIGTKIRNYFKWPALQLAVKEELCKDCRKCDKECPMSLGVNDMVKKGAILDSECVFCGSCADACPEGVLRYSFRGRK